MTTQTPTSPRTDNTLRLRDGRTLGYAEYGDPAGKPAIFFHGMPGSRLEGALAHEAAVRAGVRIISPDRPGYGISSFQKGRTFQDWPGDVTQLADSLGFERFAIAGVSGGGPYVAVCALRIPERLTRAVIVSGVGPFNVPGATEGMSRQNRLLFRLSRTGPIFPRLALAVMGIMLRRSPDRAAKQMLKSMPKPDQDVLKQPGVLDRFMADALEAGRAGARGGAHESVMYARPWDFRLEDIKMPVTLWQGDADKNVPIVMGRHQAQAIPNCEARWFLGRGPSAHHHAHRRAVRAADDVVGRGVGPCEDDLAACRAGVTPRSNSGPAWRTD